MLDERKKYSGGKKNPPHDQEAVHDFHLKLSIATEMSHSGLEEGG